MIDNALLFDVDDTILNFSHHLCDIHYKMYGVRYGASDLTGWSLPKDLEDTFREYENWLYLTAPILPKARSALKAFRGNGYKIILMTARSEDYRRHTRFHLALNDIQYDDIYFNKNKSLKINRLSDKYNVIAFADDKTETIIKVAENTDVPNVYLINMVSNRGDDIPGKVIRINHIGEIKL